MDKRSLETENKALKKEMTERKTINSKIKRKTERLVAKNETLKKENETCLKELHEKEKLREITDESHSKAVLVFKETIKGQERRIANYLLENDSVKREKEAINADLMKLRREKENMKLGMQEMQKRSEVVSLKIKNMEENYIQLQLNTAILLRKV